MKKYIIYILLCMPVLSAYGAETQNQKRAQELLDFLIAGQGDSIYVRLNDEAKAQLTPEMFGNIFSGLEQQLGKLQSRGEWGEIQNAGVTIHFCDLQFEKMPIRFIAAFDADGKANTIRLIPVPSSVETHATAEADEEMKEFPIEVVCGEYKLPGVITLPEEGGKTPPVVILVHGSGPNDRDETIGAYKPFRDIARGLAERGIASIRYDKRTKVYGGQFAPAGKATYDTETVDDVLAAIDLAQTIRTVDAGQIYVLGHSLGAMLAPRIAERAGNRLAGVIMLAGNARPLEDMLIEQITYISSLGNDLSGVVSLDKLQKQADNVKHIGTDAFDETIGLPPGTTASYWVFSNAYHQVEVAKGLTLPVLILQGERDYQVTMTDFGIWRSALSDKPNVFFKSYPALNHLFHEGQGKSTPAEYSGEDGKIPPYVLNDISGWVKNKNSIAK